MENMTTYYHALWNAEEAITEALRLPIREERYYCIHRWINSGWRHVQI